MAELGGLNDRFAFCTVRAAEVYATRIQNFVDACVTLGGMHSESFLSLVARRHGLRISTTAMRAVRVRANGQVASNDVSELTDVAQMREPVAA